jgi:hydroxymethylpyrimidine pyrophosphatase-like HAD family hydrolase
MTNRPDFSGLLLVSDMDGTLLSSRNQLSLENIVAIERFVAFGGRFTVATGRIPSIAAPTLFRLAINAPGIFYNGGMIYDFANQRIVWQTVLQRMSRRLSPISPTSFPKRGSRYTTME